MTYVKILFFELLSLSIYAQTIDQYKTTTASGSINTYTISNTDFGAYRTNEKWLIDFTGVTANSGAATLNRAGYGAIAIKNPDGTDVTSGTLKGRIQLSYNGTYFYVVGSSGGGSTISIGSFDNTSTANGLDLTSNTLKLHAADATNPGAISTTTQSFSGAKTFTNDLIAGANFQLAQNSSGISGSNADLNTHPSTNIRLTNAGLVSLASISTAGILTGHQLWLHNDTGGSIVIINNYGSPPVGSSKIETSFGTNISVPNQGSIILEFDSTDNAWRLVSNVGPASGSYPGYLSSTDWTTFNNKQAALSGTGFVKISGTTISYDNSTYLTGNQTITLSGDISGSGTTAITTAIGASKVTNTMLAGSIADGKLANSYLYADGTRALTGDWATGGFNFTGVKSLTISGTGGNGFVNLATQSSNPAQPTSSVSLFSNSGNHLSWMTPADAFSRTITAGILTANRTYTLRDYSGSFLIDNGTNTLSGATTFASNITNNITWSSTATATANNQALHNYSGTITLDTNSGDKFSLINVAPTFIAGSTNQIPTLLNLKSTVVITGGLITGGFNGTISGTGMTPGTYTNVSPTSSSSGGTGALVTVTITSSTTGSITAVTTPGSGYVVGSNITFANSLFAGTGTSTIGVYLVSGQSLSGGVLTLDLAGDSYSGARLTNYNLIDFRLSGTFKGGITPNANGLVLTDPSGNALISTSTGTTTFNNTVSGAISSWSGTMTVSRSWNSSVVPLTVGGAAAQIGAGTANLVYVNPSAATTGYLNAATSTLSNPGTGYSTGTNIALTGGTGTGATININSVTSGAIATWSVNNPGQNYSAGDILTVSGGGANATITITTTDFNARIVNINSGGTTTDAKSNNRYAYYYGGATINITSTQVGSVTGFLYNPTVTSIGSFKHRGIVSVPSGTLNGVGITDDSPSATWEIRGSGSNSTFKTVGVGTSTNLNWTAYQSDGTTQIAFLKDNGDFQVGLSTSKLGFFGTSATTQPTTGVASSTFTANTGTAINDASTFDGYTIKQVVKALRNLGIIQ